MKRERKINAGANPTEESFVRRIGFVKTLWEWGFNSFYAHQAPVDVKVCRGTKPMKHDWMCNRP